MKSFLRPALFFLFIFCINLSAQSTQQWQTLCSIQNIFSVAEEGEIFWIGTDKGLVKFNKNTGEKFNYDVCNSPLPSNYVYAVAVDKDGNKWISTYYGGFFKFDGKNWDSYVFFSTHESYKYIKTTSLSIDKEGNKWIGTADAGLFKFDGKEWTQFTPYNSKILSSYINGTTVDKNGVLWVATDGGGVSKYVSSQWISYDRFNAGFTNDCIVSINTDSEGNIWVASSQEYAKYDGSKWTVFNSKNCDMPNGLINSFAVDKDGTKWVGLEGNGLQKLTPQGWVVYHYNNLGQYQNPVKKITISSNNQVWIYGYGKFAKFTDSNWHFYNLSNSALQDNFIRNIKMDKDKNIWLSTYFSGIYKFDLKNWSHYDTIKTYFLGESINSINFDSKGNKWFGTNFSGVAKFDDAKWTFYDTTNSGLPHNSIGNIVEDSKGNMWIGTWNGIAKFNGTGWVVYNKSNSGIPFNNALRLYVTSNDHIWIKNTEGKLCEFDGENWKDYTGSTELPKEWIDLAAVRYKGYQWLPKYGLGRYDGTNWEVYNTVNSPLPSIDIGAIVPDNAGNLWIGTWDGLAKFDGSNWTVYNTLNSKLPDNRILSLLVDKANNKLIITEEGGLTIFNENGIVLDVNKNETIITDFALQQNYPNPFNPATSINYSVSKAGQVKLVVFDLLGREIKTLVDEFKTTGNYTVNFNASSLSSGVYFYTLQAGKYRETRKMILLR